MRDTTTITPEERMEKALARAQAFVKLHGHDNTACITSGELFLFRDALKCAQTEIEHWGKLYLMMSADEQRLEANVARLTKMVDWLASKLATMHPDCPLKYLEQRPLGWKCHEGSQGPCTKEQAAGCWKEAASRAVAAGEG